MVGAFFIDETVKVAKEYLENMPVSGNRHKSKLNKEYQNQLNAPDIVNFLGFNSKLLLFTIDFLFRPLAVFAVFGILIVTIVTLVTIKIAFVTIKKMLSCFIYSLLTSFCYDCDD